MLKALVRGAFALCIVLGACTSPSEPAAAPGAARADASADSSHVASEPAPLVPRLADRVLALYGKAELLAAQDLAAKELVERVASGAWSDPLVVADSLAAAELWAEICQSADTWKRTLDALEPLDRLPDSTPWELAAALARLHASALRNAGQVERARAKTRALGNVTDWQLIGPFDNERGGGFDVAYPPETSVELATTLPGKERDVQWRRNPAVEHPLGRIGIEQLVRPNSQVVVYLATAVSSAAERELALHVGSSCAVKVFVNGRTALARKVRRPFHSDQDVVVVPLQPGTNQLVVKLAIEEWPDWVFEARFTELDGRPATGVAVDATRAATPTLAAVEPKGAAPRRVAEALAERADDALAARLAALLAILRDGEDIASKRKVELAERARDLAPDDANARWLVAWARRPSAITAPSERQVQPELDALHAVVEREPGHALAWLSLAAFYLQANPIPSRALECALRARAAAPRSFAIASTCAAALSMLDHDAEAERVGEDSLALEEARTSASAVIRLAELATARGERDAALALLERAFAERQNVGPVFDELLHRYADLGRLAPTADGSPSVASLAESLFAASPFAFDARLAVASVYEHAGDLARAREHLEAARALAPEDETLLRAAATLAVREGDLARADCELAELLRLDPGDALARRQRAWLAESSRDPFEEPYRRDARELVKAAAPAGAENEPVAVLDRTVVYRVGTDGGESHYEHLVLRVQNAGGIKALDRFGLPYPAGASLEVRELRVLRADGRVESAPPPRRDQSNGSYRVRVYDVPPLSVGDVLDVEYRVDETEPDVFGEYFGLSHVFYSDAPDPLAPVARSELVVIVPPGMQIHAAERNASGLERSTSVDEQGRTVHRWVAKNLVRPPLESAMPRREEFAPRVDLSTYANWNEFAKWWWALIEDEFVSTPAMKTKVAELTAGLTTEHDKVRALARFVGQEIRYNAWEFGPHGYQPYSASTIFERRFGDCKDKSILLVELLKQIGVEANPVVIKADYFRPDEPLAAAMVEHFNHCIAYVKPTAERPGYYLDATADRNPIEYLRSDDQGANVLHVDASGGTVHAIPYAPPEENARMRKLRVELEPDGSGTVAYRDTSNGAFGVQLRYQFGGEKGDLAKRFADSVGEAFGKVDVRRVETSALEDLGVPASLEAEFGAQNLWTRESDGATLRLAFERFGLDRVAVEPPDERRFDVVLDRPFLEDLELVYALPEGARVVELPPAVDIRAEGLCSYSLSVEQRGNELAIRRLFRLDERRVPLARYADFRDTMQAIRQAEQRAIRIQPPSPRETGKTGGDK
ncbi:MAG: DUF3857 domain-containing protein [Planctomycetes bacterium]|nr:DUF3857 domain-containing protein [Planctomycetota bacterium]